MMRKKKLILIVALSCVACTNKNNPSLTITDEEVTVEYCDASFDADSLIQWGNFDELTHSNLDTCLLGNQTITFQATKNGKTVEVEKTVNVVDSVSPVFEKTIDEIKVKQGESVYIENYFLAKDPVDGIVEVKLTSEVDTNEVGNHSREVIAVDKNGNESRVVVTIVVQGVGSTQNNTNSTGNTSNNQNTNSSSNSQGSSSSPGNGGWIIEESWSSSGSYEVDSGVSVEHKVE
ncbi:MAG: hypothetical protein RR660_07655 [Anaerorhabdus sp.]|uniref:hypothetical protein n=2 Tax=Anaerorhabdus sp. TaxID=1872524 RepID=UPI002FCB82BE